MSQNSQMLKAVTIRSLIHMIVWNADAVFWFLSCFIIIIGYALNEFHYVDSDCFVDSSITDYITFW